MFLYHEIIKGVSFDIHVVSICCFLAFETFLIFYLKNSGCLLIFSKIASKNFAFCLSFVFWGNPLLINFISFYRVVGIIGSLVLLFLIIFSLMLFDPVIFSYCFMRSIFIYKSKRTIYSMISFRLFESGLGGIFISHLPFHVEQGI